MYLKAVLNRDGGTFKTTDMDAYAEQARQIFHTAGHELDIEVVNGSDVVEKMRDVASGGNVDALLAGGGDGTISAAAEIAWQSELPLGVIPAGTMNLFARSLNLPLDIHAALEVLARGRVGQADIGSANGKAFVHQFSVGLHARMVRYRNEIPYVSRAGKIAASIRASVGALLNPPRFEIEFDVDGRREQRSVSAISVSNNMLGDNGLLVAEDVTGGHLGFYIADPLDPKAAVGLALDILRGRMRQNPAISAMEAEAVELHFPKLYRSANYVLDGELIRLPPDMTIRIHPGALKVLVPQE